MHRNLRSWSQSSGISCCKNACTQCSSKVIERTYLAFRVPQNHKYEGTEGGTYVSKWSFIWSRAAWEHHVQIPSQYVLQIHPAYRKGTFVCFMFCWSDIKDLSLCEHPVLHSFMKSERYIRNNWCSMTAGD